MILPIFEYVLIKIIISMEYKQILDIVVVFIQLATCVAVFLGFYFGNRNITRQARKNAKIQWIEVFRINVVELMYKSYLFDKKIYLNTFHENKIETDKTYTEFVKQISYNKLLLNKNDSLQMELYNLLTDIFLLAKEYRVDNRKMSDMYDLSEKIINQEQDKI